VSVFVTNNHIVIVLKVPTKKEKLVST